MTKTAIGLVVGLSVLGGALMGSAPARADDPLMGKSPWNFDPVNRAAMAVAIKQVEDGSDGGSGNGVTVVCGGTSGATGSGSTGAGSSAAGNNNCVVVSNSDGAIVDVDQHSNGNQTAGSTANSTSNNSSSSSAADDVASILNGGQ